MLALRQKLQDALPRLKSAQVKRMPAGRVVRVAGLVIVMQRPSTAKGTVFTTLEDEEGFVDLILHQKTYERHKEILLNESMVIAKGVVQRDGNSVSLLVQSFYPIRSSSADVDEKESDSPRKRQKPRRHYRSPARIAKLFS